MNTKRMSWKKINKLVDAGDAAICAYSVDDYPDAIILETYDRQGRARRQIVEIAQSSQPKSN